MKAYYDTGVLLKLYTAERESGAVQAFVVGRGEPLRVTDLHLSECTAALRLKQFRREGTTNEASKALAHLAGDLRNNVLVRVAIDWERAWDECRRLLDAHAARTGARTLDALHVSCALSLNAKELVTTDRRQATLAKAAGLRAVNPVP